ncbi:all-trans retinoic acid-induced differentiation factor isoform X2 [Psammomys obesus]|uniref:all-trans retinoic acid-induced differentiation factor isoform X2 n=1 Tax=Psammomys obesus TaxID=48139 RepID=UPI002452986D|nr:all-trans retinoic acid-induced differentiation factor isoform X2 [Psammomys obesus]
MVTRLRPTWAVRVRPHLKTVSCVWWPLTPGLRGGRNEGGSLSLMLTWPTELDLQNCSLKDPGTNIFQASTAVIIDLQANPLKDDLASTFRGFTQLQTLILPQDVTCPGGVHAWDSVTSFTDKQICQGQKDLCNSTGSPEMCPENGSCASDGPGLLQCLCADGFHGYKCTRQGSFPLLMFFGILGSTTLAISILLWGTQRRKAKAS